MARNLKTSDPVGFGGKTTLLGVKICAANLLEGQLELKDEFKAEIEAGKRDIAGGVGHRCEIYKEGFN